MSRSCCTVHLAAASAVLCWLAAVRPSSADIVLLDEYWTPEIVVNDVVATEVDTLTRGDPAQAKSGECSAMLENRTGAPNVRFRSAACVTLAEIPPETSELRLWYRTDAWTSTWEAQIWVWYDGLTEGPVQVLAGVLDGGGDKGALIADDAWHQAKGILHNAGQHYAAPQDQPLPCYVWLAPKGGWDVPHRTFVDRIEVITDEGHGDHPAKDPPRRVRPHAGAQTDGPGWIWWEAEDATEHNVPPGGAFAPDTAEQQGLLSNGAWLQHHDSPFTATWKINAKEPGEYDLWCRAMGSPFEWRLNGGPWRKCDERSGWRNETKLRNQSINVVPVNWVLLGKVQLTAGAQVLEARNAGNGVCGFDCFLLTRAPFTPDGKKRPDGTTAP